MTSPAGHVIIYFISLYHFSVVFFITGLVMTSCFYRVIWPLAESTQSESILQIWKSTLIGLVNITQPIVDLVLSTHVQTPYANNDVTPIPACNGLLNKQTINSHKQTGPMNLQTNRQDSHIHVYKTKWLPAEKVLQVVSINNTITF